MKSSKIKIKSLSDVFLLQVIRLIDDKKFQGAAFHLMVIVTELDDPIDLLGSIKNQIKELSNKDFFWLFQELIDEINRLKEDVLIKKAQFLGINQFEKKLYNSFLNNLILRKDIEPVQIKYAKILLQIKEKSNNYKINCKDFLSVYRNLFKKSAISDIFFFYCLSLFAYPRSLRELFIASVLEARIKEKSTKVIVDRLINFTVSKLEILKNPNVVIHDLLVDLIEKDFDAAIDIFKKFYNSKYFQALKNYEEVYFTIHKYFIEQNDKEFDFYCYMIRSQINPANYELIEKVNDLLWKNTIIEFNKWPVKFKPNFDKTTIFIEQQGDFSMKIFNKIVLSEVIPDNYFKSFFHKASNTTGKELPIKEWKIDNFILRAYQSRGQLRIDIEITK